MTTLLLLLHTHTTTIRDALEARRENAKGDVGLSTLEMAVIALGTLGLAVALVTALTAAVNGRLEQIQ
ncbi:hypothetical protein NI17_010450 [Thermobifida halotolerans]|uniref:Uncharacterized protein n=1 Tax=Thermobifida halotolerans TaxID=483545 RepID=A0AA97M5Y6_9ACTN|nr:hypothetical protein [Thermobifida halotolerans]UOE21482.1 hypothetical protein NI17_010450 [Thermobifida halotolerans]